MLIILGGTLAVLLAGGFVVFASSVTRQLNNPAGSADAIVVLTGGPTRIAEGAKLLRLGRGKRLLISGVNPQTGKASLMKISGLDLASFDCCVDLGYQALDTIGNADETRKWAEAHGYTRLLVVTSNYHMPRSLMELLRAMPNAKFIPHAVPHRKKASKTPWWKQPGLTRELAREYLKFLPAAARLVVSRVTGSFTASNMATMSDPPPHS